MNKLILCGLITLSLISIAYTQTAKEYNQRGEDKYEARMFKEAIDLYNKAIEINTNIPEIYFNRGNAYFFNKDYTNAISDYTKVLDINSNYVAAYCWRGNCYVIGFQKYSNAIKEYNKAIEIDSNNTLAYNNRGLVYFNLNKYLNALMDYTKQIEINKNDVVALYNRGYINDYLKNYSTAIADYTRAYLLDGNYWAAKDKRNIAYSKLINSTKELNNKSIIDICPNYYIDEPEAIKGWISYSVPTDIDTLENMFGVILEKMTISNSKGELSIIDREDRKVNEYYHLLLTSNEIMVTSKAPQIITKDTIPFNLKTSAYAYFSKYIDKYTEKTAIKVNDGYLFAFNNGEFGSWLYWLDSNGIGSYEIKSPGYPIRMFYYRNNNIYAMAGNEHMVPGPYSILKLFRQNGVWETMICYETNWSDTYNNIDVKPRLFAIDSKDNMIVNTSNNLIRVNIDHSVDSLGNQIFWNMHKQATSMVILDDIIYVGLKNCVYKYDLVNNKEGILRKY
ncbi:MAG: tetratricopeptide repeat protein [Ignavibacteriae bacterium]|nr:tetratricopeptide repeat protein [Ignavibacteriota bacterium]